VTADDYTRSIRFDLDEIALSGCDYQLSQPDPIPLKTYVDFGMDKNPKAIEEVDPLSHILEYMASIKEGEYLWLQYLVRVNREDKVKPGTWFQKQNWKEEGRDMIKTIRSSPEEVEIRSDGTEIKKLSREQADKIAAIERSLSKPAFDVGIRAIYMARNDVFEGVNVPGIITLFRQFNSETMNSLGPTRYLAKYDYPWQDYRDYRQNRDRYRIFDAYRKRSYFHQPYKTPFFVLNTEELATLFHIPGSGVQTPTLQRIPSTRRGAPSNLPI